MIDTAIGLARDVGELVGGDLVGDVPAMDMAPIAVGIPDLERIDAM